MRNTAAATSQGSEQGKTRARVSKFLLNQGEGDAPGAISVGNTALELPAATVHWVGQLPLILARKQQ
jgi:hypothetical protein